MAAPFPTTYYLAIGTAISNTGAFTELSGGSYARLACAFTGTAISGLTQTVGPWVVATAPTPAVNSYYGAIFDSLTSGNLLVYWTWAAPYTGSLTAFPSTVINMSFSNNVAVALNMALQGGQASSGSIFDAGAQIGWVNGNPMIAGMRLNCGAGGTLTAHLGQGSFLSSADIENSVYSNAFGSGNILLGISASATSTIAGGTPLTGFYNLVSTVGGASYAVTLPATTQNPGGVGSFLIVNVVPATACKIFPDNSSVLINSLSAGAAISMTGPISATFFRASALQWYTTPTVPS